MNNRAPNKAASAVLIYPTDIITHAKGQIYTVFLWNTVCNSKRLETLNIYQDRAGTLYCSYRMTDCQNKFFKNCT